MQHELSRNPRPLGGEDVKFGHYSPFSWENTSWFIGPVVGVGSVHDKLTPMYGGIVQWRFLSASLTNSGVLAGFNF